MSQSTTNLDLCKTAEAAALAAVGKSEIEQHTDKPAAFKAAGHSPLDYSQWSNMYEQALSRYNHFAQAKAPSTLAEQAKTPAA